MMVRLVLVELGKALSVIAKLLRIPEPECRRPVFKVTQISLEQKWVIGAKLPLILKMLRCPKCCLEAIGDVDFFEKII